MFAIGSTVSRNPDYHCEYSDNNALLKVVAFSKKKLVDISCGYRNAIFLTNDNTVWESNMATFSISSDSKKTFGVPKTVATGDQTVKSVHAGFDFYVILSTTGQAYGYGQNMNYQLDSAGYVFNSPTILEVSRYGPIIDCSCGVTNAVFLTSTGKALVTGKFGKTRQFNTPTVYPCKQTIVSISMGAYGLFLITST